jgi:hypothetical protein
LSTFLTEALNCNVRRIANKFKGSNSIGVHKFKRRAEDLND